MPDGTDSSPSSSRVIGSKRDGGARAFSGELWGEVSPLVSPDFLSEDISESLRRESTAAILLKRSNICPAGAAYWEGL